MPKARVKPTQTGEQLRFSTIRCGDATAKTAGKERLDLASDQSWSLCGICSRLLRQMADCLVSISGTGRCFLGEIAAIGRLLILLLW